MPYRIIHAVKSQTAPDGVSGRELSNVSATVPGMTSSPPTAVPQPITPVPRDVPTGGGLDVTVWYLATCHRCDTDLSTPFTDEDDRDEWAARHVTDTGHTVHLTVNGLDTLTGLHMGGVLNRLDAGWFRYMCPADQCSRWQGPFVNAGLALASWRSHTGIVR